MSFRMAEAWTKFLSLVRLIANMRNPHVWRHRHQTQIILDRAKAKRINKRCRL
jgi:hypothetical protein